MTRPILTLTALAIAAVMTVGCGGSAVAPSPTPMPSPSAVPSAPSDAPSGGLVVDLDTVGGGPVKALVTDESGDLVGASSGDPADGVSVDFDDVRVEAIDDDSIQLTWADYPAPNEYTVVVSSGADGGIAITIARPEPSQPTDATALDRTLVLDFGSAVTAAAVTASIG